MQNLNMTLDAVRTAVREEMQLFREDFEKKITKGSDEILIKIDNMLHSLEYIHKKMTTRK